MNILVFKINLNQKLSYIDYIYLKILFINFKIFNFKFIDDKVALIFSYNTL